MNQALDSDGSTENAIIVRKNRCFQSKTAVFVATVDKNDTVSQGFIWFHSKMKP